MSTGSEPKTQAHRQRMAYQSIVIDKSNLGKFVVNWMKINQFSPLNLKHVY